MFTRIAVHGTSQNHVEGRRVCQTHTTNFFAFNLFLPATQVPLSLLAFASPVAKPMKQRKNAAADKLASKKTKKQHNKEDKQREAECTGRGCRDAMISEI